MRLFISLFFVCLFSFCIVAAQSSKKGGRLYNSAIRYSTKKQNEKAWKEMERCIRKDPNNADAYSQLGQWYFEAHLFAQAAAVFRRGSQHCKNGDRRFAMAYAKSLLYSGQPENALSLISSYSNVKDSAEWNKMKAQAYFIEQAMSQPLADTVTNLGIRVNTADPELFPAMAVDTQTLYFTRRINNMDQDLFMADRDTCSEWHDRRNLGDPPNTPDQESAQFISADGHYLFFTRCENRSSDGFAEGGCDLFMAYRVANDSAWTIAQPFGLTINTPWYEGMPSLSPDNRELYFVSDRPGGYGGYDIWVSRFEDGLWQAPVNAGPHINTAGNETAPYMNVDNQTLYFTSDGWPGMGGKDIFMSHKINDSLYTKATNLGYPINTAYEEQSECVTLDGKTLYFASDRQGPAGNYDIYSIPLPPSMKPVPVSYLKGYVFDSLTKERLNYATIYICNAASGDTIYQFQSNRGDGSFLITLHLGNTYAIHTWRMDYTPTDDTLIFDKQYLQQPLVRNLPMLPSGYIRPVNDSLIAMLHFDVMSVALSDSDKATLTAALAPWAAEKGFILYVNAYTDNTGTPMINEELSQARAALVAREILSLGIDETMIQAKGLGEAHMIATNDTPDGQKKNRRVEIILRR